MSLLFRLLGVGLLATLVDFLTLLALNYFGLGVLISSICGYILGTVIVYLLTEGAVPNRNYRRIPLELAWFFLVGVVGAVLTAAIMSTLESWGWNLLQSKAISVALVFIVVSLARLSGIRWLRRKEFGTNVGEDSPIL